MRLMSVMFLTLCTSASALTATSPGGHDPRAWHFRVFLDDREIGYHDFTVTDTEDGQRLESEASFDVKFLFINAFKYRHQSLETWNGGCLRRIEATTRTNGERNSVAGEDLGDAFALRAVTGDRRDVPESLALERGEVKRVDADCVSTFAYWDRSFIDKNRLLNPQTGELVDVEISPMGTETIEVSGIETPVVRYRIALPDSEIQVCYTRTGERWEWVALESQIEGRTLRYRREGGDELPAMLSSATVDPVVVGARASGSP